MTQGDKKSEFVIAAFGASAGGLEPLESFFKRMPAHAGIAFVIVQHLAPDHATALPELLGRHTEMPVDQAVDNKNVEPNHVYVIPPNATLTIKDGSLRVTSPPVEARGARTPIDGFFSSLAQDCGENAVCIMLSGTGTDGTLGLRAIKEHGGMAMAQTTESAKYDAILRSAIATGLVDHVLPVEEIPAKLMEYSAYLVSLNEKPNHIREQIGGHLSKIHAVLRRRAGHDFSQYKESTIARRLERRMKASQIDTVEKYVELLENKPEEADRLFNDLLIGVTQFFRDAEAFAALEKEVIPNLFEGKEPGDHVRVCIVGCATGEEAYSIAILLSEHASRLEKPPAIQVFATDIDERALETARKGSYPASVAEHLNPEWLERFFIQQDGGYQVKREIRAICLFSVHSFIKDPPFSRLDLISCRNVMIYLGQDLQHKIVPLFHYALRPGGYLFLGPSESASSHRELFEAVDKKHRIFQRKETLPRPVIAFPFGDVIRTAQAGGQRLQPDDPNLTRQLERIIVQRYRPSCVTVRENGDAVYFSGGTSRYLEQPAGSPDANVINMAREGLRIPLRTALHKAINARERVVQKQLSVQTNGMISQVDLTVEPIAEFRTANLYMIVFEDSAPSTAPPQGPASLADASGEETIRHLEDELRSAREHAQAVYEELESSNEELKSANEEYQSTNEELETSKEELQSFNEELQTVNAEVSRKVTELDHANSDLQNFLNSTQIATIFLDQELRVRNFTPAAGAVFRLIASDAGRPITDLAAQFAAGDLVPDIQEVLRTLIPRERQLAGLEGQHYQMRVLPYRSVQNVIEGVVLTFTDVTETKRAELLIEEAKAYAENIVETVRESLLVLDAGARVRSANQAFYDTFHVSRKETVNVTLFELGDGQWDIPELRRLLGELLPANKTIEDFEVQHDFPTIGRRTMLLNAREVLPRQGHEPLILLAIEDVTKQRLTEQARRDSEERYRTLFHVSPIAVYSCDAAGVIVDFNARAAELWGRAPKSGDTDERFCGSYKMHRPDGSFLPHEECPMAEVLAGTISEARDAEVQIERPDGTWVAVAVNIRALRNDHGEITGAINCFADITERKDAERIRLELKEREQKAAIERAMRDKEAELARGARTLMVGEMATYMAHEINQPLAGVVTNAQAGLRWLMGEPAKVQEAIDSLSLIVRDGNRASAVIRRIRSFVRNEIAEPVALDITEIIGEALDLLRFDLAKNQIELSFDLASMLPPVRGDRVQLEQVILNLAINASDAMISVTNRPREMLVSAQLSSDDNILVSIRDSGVGVEQQHIDRIYDAFFTTKPTGVGMGLSICLSIVLAHGGRIWATRNEGPGLTVQFTLPADRGNSS